MSNYFRATNLEERIRLPLAKPKLKQVFHCHLMALATVVPQGKIAFLSEQACSLFSTKSYATFAN